MSKPRLSDLAAALHLNIATVSRALRQDPRVSAATQERVRAAADRLGYRPHWGARALAEGRSRAVWFLIPGLVNRVEREPAAWAGRYLLDKGYDLFLAQHFGDEGIYSRLLDRLAHGGADGAIIVPGSQSPEAGAADKELLAKGFPFLYLDQCVPGLPVPVVTTKNFEAAAEALDRLSGTAVAEGHPLSWVHDGFVPQRNNVEKERSKGLRREADRLGLPVYSRADPSPLGLSLRPAAFFSSNTSGLQGRSVPPYSRAAVFDEASGNFGCVQTLVLVQDFQALGEASARLILDAVEGRVAEPELRFPLLEVRDQRP